MIYKYYRVANVCGGDYSREDKLIGSMVDNCYVCSGLRHVFAPRRTVAYTILMLYFQTTDCNK